jgi:hypothetical protein
MPANSAALVFMYTAKGVFERVGFENEAAVAAAEEKLLNDVLQNKYIQDLKQSVP